MSSIAGESLQHRRLPSSSAWTASSASWASNIHFIPVGVEACPFSGRLHSVR